MSRSRRKHPYIGLTTARSEKYDKRLARRKLRRKTRQLPDHEDAIAPALREVSDVWTFAKDGRQEVDKNSKYLRK